MALICTGLTRLTPQRWQAWPLLLCLVVTLGLAGCTTTQSVSPVEFNRSGMEPWTDAIPAYRINPGDKFLVSFPRTPEMNENALVAPDGTVGLRATGQLKVGGLTLAEAEKAIASASLRILAAPIVNVGLDEAAGAVVYVGGAVREPGVYPLTRPSGVFEAILRAHSFDPEARMNQIVLIRRGPSNKPMLRTIDVQEFASTASLADDVPLVAGDMVFVPRSNAAEFDLWMSQFVTHAMPFSSSFGYFIQPSGIRAPF